MKKINAGYGKVAVPANTYPKQDKAVDVIGYSAHLVVSCALPAEMVYAMTKSIAENIKDLAPINKDVEKLTPKLMAEDIGVPFHPGAAKFYKEKGAM